MPRRKGYGIPPTKRIKIDNEIENNENELNDISCEKTATKEIQKSQNENYVKDASTSVTDQFSNLSTANGIKYLHKKFKKMAAVLSDDCTPPVEVNDKFVHISESRKSPVLVTSVPVQDVSLATVQSSLPQRTSMNGLTTTIEKCVNNNQFTISQNSSTAQTKLSTAYNNVHNNSRITSAPVTSVVAHTLSSEEDINVSSTNFGRHACPYCKLVCSKPSVLQKHIRAHTNERPFPCRPCGFAFKTQSNLYKHRRSRSHTLKLEEIGEDNKTYDLGEEVCDEDDSSQGVKDNSEASNEENKTEQPKKTIYKPKFHKAAIYIQNNATTLESSSNNEPIITTTLNKLGLQLKIPNRSIPSTPSTCPNSSISPEVLQRRITELISQNQAIVETTDPFWSKKFYHRSKETSSLCPTEKSFSLSVKSTVSSTENVEEKLPTESKLAYALLQPKTMTKSVSMNDSNAEESQPLNLTISRNINENKNVKRVKESSLDIDVKPYAELHLKPIQNNIHESKREIQVNNNKFVRPTSLPLKPGTFIPKKLLPGSISVLPLISPETPRPNKSYGQMYIGGNAYTYLGLKCSTRSTFCTLHKSQPMYVSLSPEHNKISMYSNWKVRSEVDPYLRGVSPAKAMSCYDSRQRYSSYTVVHGKTKDAVTHSSYWLNRSKLQVETGDTKLNNDDENKENSLQLNDIIEKGDDPSKQFKLCFGKIETSDDYTYVRGRGRGKYVCTECGIRCRKPSMLKKHVRTHTDVRPYTCKYCVFSFKTKGNLTKHMKSKAHYKKCIELGIVPVPTIVDYSYVDEEILSKQAQQIDEGQDIEETEEEDDDDDDDDDDENEDEYGDDDPKGQLEREVAKSLLSLSKMSSQTVFEQYANAGLVPLNARPNTYPYNFIVNPHLSSKPRTPTLTLISEQKERETVSKNTGLARELQPTLNSTHTVKQKCESQMGRYYFGSPSEKEVRNASDLQESVVKDSAVTSVFPIDLSSKNTPERNILRATVSNTSRSSPANGITYATTTCISEILTPVSEPVLLASICSTIDRLPAVVNNIADTTNDSEMLHTYLKERAVQDLKTKQQYQSPHIKVDQHEFNIKYKTYNEAFHVGANEKRESPIVPAPKRKNHFGFQNEVEKAFVKVDRSSDIDSKENFVVTNETEKNDCSTSVIIVVGSPNSGTNNSPKRLKAGFMSPLPNAVEDGRSKCVVCNKIFSKPSQLRLHVNIHYFEQPFRCESCAVSFRTKGHLHKHLSSNSHQNKVSMNSASGGQTSSNNPRPFKCDDCSVGFRIHGHLAKHLRSKMHIMKLECLGKLPFGTYAEMERCGINMNDIDTTDCENSLESLQRIAKGVVNSVMYVNSADEEGKMITDSSPY